MTYIKVTKAKSQQKIPVTSMSEGTLSNLVEEIKSPSQIYSGDTNETERRLHQKLFIGEYMHGLYAMPSLIDRKSFESKAILINQLHNYCIYLL